MKKVLYTMIVLLVFHWLNGHSQNQAQFISQTMPDDILPGEEFACSIAFKNTGTTTWSDDGLYRLGSQFPQDNFYWGTNRISLPHEVAPGDTVVFNATLTAPFDEGLYYFQWRMVQDGVEWFGDKSNAIYFPVTGPVVDSLLTPGDRFAVSDHIVSTSLFHWFGENSGQLSGPWIPVEGRASWTGDVEFWKRMIKQLMLAHVDVLYIIVIPDMEDKRGNLFLALSKLRQEGWDVPKVCPFFDPIITYTLLGYHGNCATEEGIDELVGHYIRFYKQYYSVNTDEYADDYIYTQDNRPVLNIWHIHLHIDNYWLLTRDDITNRLSAEFGNAHPIFNNDIKMINNAYSPAFSFADERLYQFEMQEYKIDKTWHGITTSLLKPGYWDQNVRNPGYFLPRDGGAHYSDSWNLVNQSDDITRVYIESFNEYDEGSGIFAARTDTIYKKTDGGMNNTEDDIWSANDDPFEYIKTTAAGTSVFNDDELLDAKVIWHNIPDTLQVGEHFTARIVMRNEGNELWNDANGFQFGQKDKLLFGEGRFPIDDNDDEIPFYGGIFRGRTKTFQMEIIAPDSAGIYATHWSMLKNNDEWFGEILTKEIRVSSPSGIHPPKQESFIIFPNPVKDHLHIYGTKPEHLEAGIYNAKGECVQTNTLLPKEQNTLLVNRLKQGVYFIKVGNRLKKFIKL